MTGALILVPLYCVLNRLAGEGAIFRALNLPGRPLWYAVALGILIAWPFIGLPLAALFAGSFGLWRTLGWADAIDGGTTDGQRERDFWVMVGRGTLLFPAFIFTGASALLFVTPLLIAGAYDLSANYLRKGKDPIPLAEFLAGSAIGWAFCLIAYFS